MNDKTQFLDCICYTCANYYICKVCCEHNGEDKHDIELIKQKGNCRDYVPEEENK